ncbi:MAG: AAA family ATPase, partial [Nanoarchaeota archaeon]|nr:AAA family ATPase [Nanoarchaeota archaeon]
PGTGKSQVVLNLIANAVWNNKTILFASKNNRAVDVVNNKFKEILSKDLIVRTGSNQHRKNAKLQIHKLFQQKNDLNISPYFNNNKLKIKKIISNMNLLKQKLENLSKVNEEIEQLQNKTDQQSKQVPRKLYNLCSKDKFEKINKFEIETDIINHFANKSFFRKILEWIFPSIYQKREQVLFKKYYNLLSTNFKDYLTKNIQLNGKGIQKSLEWILLFKQMDLLRKETNNLKRKQIKSHSYYALDSQIRSQQEKKVIVSRNIFENYWLEKLKNTSPKDENHVSRYIDATEKLERYIENYSLWKQLVQEQKNEIKEILQFLPIWVVTNLSAKKSLPLEKNIFDLLIIDEASQCDIASALPLFYRAKQVVIIGDPKQLKHISILKETQDKKMASENKIPELYLDYAYSKNSLYDLGDRIIKNKNKLPLLLNQHYRSYKDIINFSNHFFYEKKLKIKTNDSKLIHKDIHPRGIKWFNISGKTQNLFNKNEAIEVIRILKTFKKSNLKKVSFGIVTLFRAQMELIAKMVNNSKDLKDMDITIGTTHRFQGDEKDIIIFSLAISEGIKQKTLNWINSTSQLLNVAITRARSVLIIVGDKKKCFKIGGLLKDLAEYKESHERLEINFDSPIEEELFNRLIEEKIEVSPQYEIKVKGKKPYRLDFALFINEKKFNIEVDGDKAHSQRIAEDILRDIHLRMEGWQIRRFQASEIQNNIEEVIREIKRLC